MSTLNNQHMSGNNNKISIVESFSLLKKQKQRTSFVTSLNGLTRKSVEFCLHTILFPMHRIGCLFQQLCMFKIYYMVCCFLYCHCHYCGYYYYYCFILFFITINIHVYYIINIQKDRKNEGNTKKAGKAGQYGLLRISFWRMRWSLKRPFGDG